MTEVQRQRLIEVKFYLILQKLSDYHSNVDDLLTLIETLALFKVFNVLIVQDAAMKILSDHGYKPTKSEIALLLWADNTSIRNVAKFTCISNTRVYQLVEEFKKDPYPIKTVFTNECRKNIHIFLEAFAELNKIGGAL